MGAKETPTTPKKLELTEMEKKALEVLPKFKEIMKVEEMEEEDRKFCTDKCLCRYLRARQCDLDLSEKMLKETLAWRKDYRPQDISPDEFYEHAKDGNSYLKGKSVNGHPVVIIRARADKTVAPTDFKLRYCIFIMEQAIRQMEEKDEVEKWIWMFDMEDYNPLKQGDSSVASKWLPILQNHYPERLYRAYILAPWIFSMFWKLVTPFVDKVTAKKVVILSTSSKLKDKRAKITQDFGEAEIPEIEKCFGGEAESEYDHEVTWKEMWRIYNLSHGKKEEEEEEKEKETKKDDEDEKENSSEETTENDDGTDSSVSQSTDSKKEKKRKKKKSSKRTDSSSDLKKSSKSN